MQSISSPSKNVLKSSGYKWQVLGTVIFGFFMILLDVTVVNVAFQTLREEFGASITDSQWIISIYVLAMGIVMPLAGFLADRFGSKKIYLLGLGLFAFGSLLCGASSSLMMLIISRMIQGIGGGIAMPLGVSLLLQTFPPHEQGMALGIYGIAALVAPALGPIVGGWLVGLDMWRLIFFINPPIGLIGIVLGYFFLREKKSSLRLPLDLAGIVTEIIGFGSILYAASLASEHGWTASGTLVWFSIGIAGLIAFTFVELFFAKDPLLDLRLYKNPIFLNANMLGYVSVLALFGAEFLLPIYLQFLRGTTPLETGLILLPMALTSGVLVMLSGRIYDSIGPRPLMVVGFSILVINTWQLAQIQADTSIGWIIFLLALRGISLGLTVQTTLVTALSVVPPDELPRGSSLTNATRQVVQSIGVALLATVLASTISPEVQVYQNQRTKTAEVQDQGLCEELSLKTSMMLQGVTTDSARLVLPYEQHDLRQRACSENVAGFERSYQVTFYAALVALLLGSLLPGWPKKWVGRKGHPAASPPDGA